MLPTRSSGFSALGRIPYRRRPVPAGDAMTRETLLEMRRVVRRSLEDPDVIAAAVDAVRPVRERWRPAQVDALRAWLLGRIDFLPDPNIDGDVLRTPAYLLAEMRRHGRARADCDDAAMLAAALAMAVGLRVRFVVQGFEGPAAPFRHVFAEAWTDLGWQDLEVTEPRTTGRLPVTRAATMEV